MKKVLILTTLSVLVAILLACSISVVKADGQAPDLT